MPQGLVPSSNAILVAGIPLVEELEAETVTTSKPGKYVIRGTTDERFNVSGDLSNVVIGIADVIAGRLRSDAFEAGDQVRILSGPIVVMAIGLANQSFTKGQALIVDAQGRVKAAAAITATIGADALTSNNTITVAGSSPPGGRIVAYAAETKTDSSDFWVMVKNAI